MNGGVLQYQKEGRALCLQDLDLVPMSAGPRKVYLRWLADSRKFNEWMNPVDYETEEYQKEQDALEQNQTTSSRSRQGDGVEAAGNKRKFSPGGDGGTKRAARQRIDPGRHLKQTAALASALVVRNPFGTCTLLVL